MVSLREAQALTNPQELWVAIKTGEPVIEDEVLGRPAAFIGEHLISIAGFDWNSTAYIAKVFDRGWHDQIRIGAFEDLYKNGWTLMPERGLVDFQLAPIVLRKGR